MISIQVECSESKFQQKTNIIPVGLKKNVDPKFFLWFSNEKMLKKGNTDVFHLFQSYFDKQSP